MSISHPSVINMCIHFIVCAHANLDRGFCSCEGQLRFCFCSEAVVNVTAERGGPAGGGS